MGWHYSLYQHNLSVNNAHMICTKITQEMRLAFLLYQYQPRISLELALQDLYAFVQLLVDDQFQDLFWISQCECMEKIRQSHTSEV
jgi:hypothetical protein